MNTSLLVAALLASSTVGQSMYQQTIDTQNKAFKELWAEDFNWKFDELPTSAKVAEDRVPYSGYIYPDTHGGTVNALQKYDQAFDQGSRAAAHERWDTSLTEAVTRRVTYTRRYGRRGTRTYTQLQTVHVIPHWHGHCNGWTSATIRHAEPRNSVERDGIVFTPADIKALLAEMYIYNENEMLASGYINPGALHAIIANWLGRGMHPIGMEADPGSEKWNYPIYGYTAKAYNRSTYHVDVQLSIDFAMSSETETDKSPRIPRQKYFNYHLNLDDQGQIVGGYYYRNSARIEMLWIPLRPKAGGAKGNERGNPHVDVDKILAIWRESVPAEAREKWAHVDPAPEDRMADTVELAHLRPVQVKPVVLASATDAPEQESAVERALATTDVEPAPEGELADAADDAVLLSDSTAEE